MDQQYLDNYIHYKDILNSYRISCPRKLAMNVSKGAQLARLKDKVERRTSVQTVVARNLRALKYTCARKDIPFDITIEDLDIPERCPLLGIKLVPNGTLKNSFSTPSIDKLNPKLGYVKGNVKIISKLANLMKNAATKEQLYAFASNIRAYMEK